MQQNGAKLLDFSVLVNVPAGGTIRGRITWNISGIENHTYTLVILYGNFSAGTGYEYWGSTTKQVAGFLQSRYDDLDFKIPCDSGHIGNWDAMAFICESFNGVASGVYDWTIIHGALTISGLPSDVDNMAYPGSRTIKFGYFNPTVPFSASDDEKINAPITYSRYIPYALFPDQYEMVKTHIELNNISTGSDLRMRFQWYRIINNIYPELFFTWEYNIPGDWTWFWTEAWVGRCSWEIDRAGGYILVIDFPASGRGLSGSYKLYFFVCQ